jgi:hypothetical protein
MRLQSGGNSMSEENETEYNAYEFAELCLERSAIEEKYLCVLDEWWPELSTKEKLQFRREHWDDLLQKRESLKKALASADRVIDEGEPVN